jgi:LacI family transcriptional regulator
VSDYAAVDGGWDFHVAPTGRGEESPPAPDWRGDGVIARVKSGKLADEIFSLGIPAVNVSGGGISNERMAVCTCDETALAALAADHLAELGLTSFGYVSERVGDDCPDGVGAKFAEILEKRGFRVDKLELDGTAPADDSWRDELDSWLCSLRKPVGVLAWNDILATYVTQACVAAGIRVPEDAAVMGGGSDELFGGVLSSPPLTTIDPDARTVGYRAAELLRRMMNGGKIPRSGILVPPAGLIQRQSTNTLAIDDEKLVKAVRFIREHAVGGINAEDVVEHVSVGRRTLENLFKVHLGSTILREIREIRMKQAKRLLKESHLAISDIAKACGYSSPEIFCRAFTRQTGESPNKHRKKR